MPVVTVQSDNSKIPGQPEYGKGWKAEFNHGCCTTCGETTPPVCTTVIQAFTRYSQDQSLVTEIVNQNNCPCQNQAPIENCVENLTANNNCS